MTADRFARLSERAIRCRELSATDWRVLACIALHADASGRAYPGMTTIAEMTGIRRQDVPRTIRRLERFRLLRCDPGGPNGANVYTVTFDCDEVSAELRTGGVRNGADRGCPQDCGQGVRNAATKVSAPVRTKHTKEQTIEHIRAGDPKSASGFETFWRAYPSRGGHPNPKKPASAKFDAAVKRGVDPELIVDAARNYASFIARSGTAGKYVKTAEVWLNKASWEQYGAPAEPEPLRAGMI